MAIRGAPVEALQRVPLFADLNKHEVGQIARLFKERRFAEGETVIQEGSGGAAFFVIESGEATVSIGGKKRSTLKADDFFGEIALIDGGRRSADITAETNLRCWGIAQREFRGYVKQHPEVAWTLLEVLVKRLRAAERSAAGGVPGARRRRWRLGG
jgi:CRP-like cAMP-binding protein